MSEQCGCDLIALGWSQELAPGRARVVRETLKRSRLPVLLAPLSARYASAAAVADELLTAASVLRVS